MATIYFTMYLTLGVLGPILAGVHHGQYPLQEKVKMRNQVPLERDHGVRSKELELRAHSEAMVQHKLKGSQGGLRKTMACRYSIHRVRRDCLPLQLRGGSWLFTPKIVPCAEGDGGIVQWRHQSSLYHFNDDAEIAHESGARGDPQQTTQEGQRAALESKLLYLNKFLVDGIIDQEEYDEEKAQIQAQLKPLRTTQIDEAALSSEGTSGHAGKGDGACGASRMPNMKTAAGGVQRTNDDSTASKASAARAGYFQDDYIELFVAKVHSRTALINRGYFARVQAVRSLITTFLDACNLRGQPCQILSLGAGFDTTYWLMKRQQKLDRCLWVEVDLPDTVARKRGIVEAHPQLSVLASVEDLGKHGATAPSSYAVDFRLTQLAALYRESPAAVARDLGGACGEIHTGDLHCIGVNLADTHELKRRLFGGLLAPHLPTLVISECVLQYLEESLVAGVLALVRECLPVSCCVSYDQIGPLDPFGRVMSASLHERGSALRAVHAAPDTAAMCKRFRAAGYEQVTSTRMLEVYNKLLPKELVDHAEGLEVFDEHEDWAVSCQHYALTLAHTNHPKIDIFNSSKTPAGAGSRSTADHSGRRLRRNGFEIPSNSPARTPSPAKTENTGETRRRSGQGNALTSSEGGREKERDSARERESEREERERGGSSEGNALMSSKGSGSVSGGGRGGGGGDGSGGSGVGGSAVEVEEEIDADVAAPGVGGRVVEVEEGVDAHAARGLFGHSAVVV